MEAARRGAVASCGIVWQLPFAVGPLGLLPRRQLQFCGRPRYWQRVAHLLLAVFAL